MVLHFCVTIPPFFGLRYTEKRIRDFWQPCSLGLSYLLFSIYFESKGMQNHKGESTLYPIINWKKDPVVSGAISLGVMMGLACAHLVLGVISDQPKRINDKKIR